jgi:YVTN family beta-propeller protein
VTVSPDGTHLYVTEGYNLGMVSVIDTNPSSPTYNTVTATIPVGSGPYAVAVSPNGNLAYVTNGFNTLLAIDTTANAVTETVPVGNGAVVVAVSPDGSRVYVTNALDNTVSVISSVFSWQWPDLVGELLGGVAAGGSGWLVIGNHFYKIPPHPVAMAIIARATAPHLRSPIENRELGQQLRNMLS